MNNTFKKRIDELGRIVIPKQIRNTFKINDFDELELYIENDNIIIKKTGGISLIKDKLDRLLSYIKKYNNINAIIIDKSDIISSNIINDKVKIDPVLYLGREEYVEINPSIKGYIKSYQLIYDSNLYGYVVFILDKKIDEYKDLLFETVNIILDLIR